MLCDRGSDSLFAYQGYGAGLDITTLMKEDARARHNIETNLVILLDCDPLVGLARKARQLKKRGKEFSSFEKKPVEFHARVRDGFLELAKRDPERWLVVDASRSQREVARSLWKGIVNKFPFLEKV